MRMTWWAVLGLSVGCGTETGVGDPSSGACSLAASVGDCPACSDGPWTCVYGDTEVTVESCGGCQARAALYDALCEAGENDLADTIEVLTTCSALTCEVRYNCSCEPICEPSNVPPVGCPTACEAKGPLPGECGWTGEGCGWL